MKNLLNRKDNDDVFITNRRYNKIKYHYKQNMIFDESTHYPNIEGLGIIKLLYIYIESFNNKKYDLFVRKYKRKIKHTRLHCSISYLVDSRFNDYYSYRNFYVINGVLKENLNYIRWRKNNNIRTIYSPAGFKRTVHANSHTYKKYIAEKKSKLRKEVRELKSREKQIQYSFVPLKELSEI